MVVLLQRALEGSLECIHRRRLGAVWRGVEALVCTGELWLTALGRALSGETTDKHRIKAADRLLGNSKLHRELPQLYAALAQWLLRLSPRPVIAVDWTGVGAKHYALSASVCARGMGRALPIFTRVYPKKRVNNPRVQRQFLTQLAHVLPPNCKPVIITDAGFYPEWFDAVQQRGWDFVGRVRNKTKVEVEDQWIPVTSLHRRASRRPKNLGTIRVRRERSRAYRIVLSKAPVRKGRKSKTRGGKKSRRKTDQRCAKQAREPWVLATSLQCQPKAVVETYSLRMQIEETFRDAKNHRHGWALGHVGCRTTARIEVLLLLAALAMAAMHAIGRAAASIGLDRHLQANTIRHRRVLSFFVLAKCVVANQAPLPIPALRAALHEVTMAIAEKPPTGAP